MQLGVVLQQQHDMVPTVKKKRNNEFNKEDVAYISPNT